MSKLANLLVEHNVSFTSSPYLPKCYHLRIDLQSNRLREKMQEQVTNSFFAALWRKKEGVLTGFIFGVLVSAAATSYLMILHSQSLQQGIINHEKTISELKSQISNQQLSQQVKLSEREKLYKQGLSVLEDEISKLRNQNQSLNAKNNSLITVISQLNGKIKSSRAIETAQLELIERKKTLKSYIHGAEQNLRDAQILAANHKQACEEYKQGKNFYWVDRIDCEKYQLAEMNIVSFERQIKAYREELVLITEKIALR